MLTLTATAFYETDWFTAVVYIVIAVIIARVVDFILARRDKAMAKLLGKTPDRADRTRYVMIRRLVFVGILFVGIGIALHPDPGGQHAGAGDARLGGDRRRRHRHRRPGADRQPGERHHDRLLAAGAPQRLHQRGRRVRHRGADLADLHVHPQRRRPAGRDPQRGVREQGRAQLLDGLARQHGDRRPRAAARRRRRARRARPCWRSASRSRRRRTASRTRVEVADIGGGGVRLRLHAWAADPLRRRELASDLRAAMLRRLTGDGLLGGRDGDGGD